MIESLIELLPLIAIMFATGTVSGTAAGLFGVGGGFVIVPALLVILPVFTETAFKEGSGQLIHVAVGTSLACIVVSSMSAVRAHHRNSAVDLRLLFQWGPWVSLGVLGGLLIAATVQEKSLRLVFAIGVLAYSIYFLFPGLFSASSRTLSTGMPTGMSKVALASGMGGFSALLGIGGGAPFTAIMVFCGRSLHQAMATAAGVGVFVALPGAIGFLLLGLLDETLPMGSIGYINIPALVGISCMSAITAPIGARLARRLSELYLRRLFGSYLVMLSCIMFYKILA